MGPAAVAGQERPLQVEACQGAFPDQRGESSDGGQQVRGGQGGEGGHHAGHAPQGQLSECVSDVVHGRRGEVHAGQSMAVLVDESGCDETARPWSGSGAGLDSRIRGRVRRAGTRHRPRRAWRRSPG
ncbi:hypothetical protein ACFFX0_00735 [Citricoccus parietis]|uniref:Uncharacterized protein n=1 Tax=Citricoccus parietis TaxID=592307 RepID=A0ABV5FT08_9MICC